MDPATDQLTVFEAEMVVTTPPELWPMFDAKADLATLLTTWVEASLGAAVETLGAEFVFRLAAMWLREHADDFERGADNAQGGPTEADPPDSPSNPTPTR